MSAYKAKTVRLPLVELGRRHFSVEQANGSLILVRRIVSDIVSEYQKVLDQQEILEVHQRQHEDDSAHQTQAAIVALVERLQAYADELVDIGVEMKDWAAGVIDFPCQVGNSQVQLCWQHGESGITHWHPNEDPCSARRRIETLPAAD